MFGHPPDDSTTGQSTGAPSPDAGLASDNGATPAGAPPAPQDTAGDYIMGDQPPQGAPDQGSPTPGGAPDASVSGAPAATDDLLDIKQQALGQLGPLVGHLDQNPEEEFRTLMMMIQAADDQSLVPKAYEAAQKITDEKAKAKALLDIVNEINYFTQAHNEQSSEQPKDQS
jgi:hypothetical protein